MVWRKIGYIGVDSGQIMVADPAYLIGEDFGELDYEAMAQDMLESKRKYTEIFFKNRNEKAVICESGIGDGRYPVYANFKRYKAAGERITELRIVFIDKDEKQIKLFEKVLKRAEA